MLALGLCLLIGLIVIFFIGFGTGDAVTNPYEPCTSPEVFGKSLMVDWADYTDYVWHDLFPCFDYFRADGQLSLEFMHMGETDHFDGRCHYAGEVNEDKEPHGFGAISCGDNFQGWGTFMYGK